MLHKLESDILRSTDLDLFLMSQATGGHNVVSEVGLPHSNLAFDLVTLLVKNDPRSVLYPIHQLSGPTSLSIL